jgi:Transposase IS200 like
MEEEEISEHRQSRTRSAILLHFVMKQVKGASSEMVNKMRKEWTGVFSWQDGYAVFSVSLHDKAKDQVLAYINNQKEHHGTGRLHSEWDDLVDPQASPTAPQASPTTEGRSAVSSKNSQGGHLAAGFNLSESI